MLNRLALHSLHVRSGAVFREAQGYELPAHYGSSADEARRAAREAVLVDRSQRGRIAVLGPDRIDFLQGQASNDVQALADGEGTYTAFLTGKGKMRGDARLWRLAGHVLLDTEPEALPLLLEHLRGFIIMEEVELEDRTAATVELGVHGPQARKALEGALGVEVPAELALHASVARPFEAGELLIVHEQPTGAPGYEVIAPVAVAGSLWERLAARIPPAGLDAMEIRRIEAGIPRFGAEMDQSTIPIEAGLQHAVSYTKGCYTGNEVILRLKTYGHVNRRVVALRILGSVPAAPLDPILLREAGGERSVGQVTSAVFSPHAGAPIALGMVRREAAEPGTALVIDRSQARLEATVVEPPLDRRDA